MWPSLGMNLFTIIYDKEISTFNGTYNATVIGWQNAEWVVVKDLPLPIRGHVNQTSYYEPNYSISFNLVRLE